MGDVSNDVCVCVCVNRLLSFTCMKVWQSIVNCVLVMALKHSHTSGRERAARISAWWCRIRVRATRNRILEPSQNRQSQIRRTVQGNQAQNPSLENNLNFTCQHTSSPLQLLPTWTEGLYLHGQNVYVEADEPAGQNQGPDARILAQTLRHGWGFLLQQLCQNLLVCFQTQHIRAVVVYNTTQAAHERQGKREYEGCFPGLYKFSILNIHLWVTVDEQSQPNISSPQSFCPGASA